MRLAQNKLGFTILEVLIAMTIFSLILTTVIMAVQSLSVARVQSLNRTALLEELYYFSEQLFTQIKDGGTLDYEEYWNRMAYSTQTQSGHYQFPTGIGNYGANGSLGWATYGSGIYLCRSNNGVSMGTGGCLQATNNGAAGTGVGMPANFSGSYQRYGQYLAQFTDYNGNFDSDLGDENGDGSIVGDDDDRAIGDTLAIWTGAMRELYLINRDQKTRTYFRWVIRQDPNIPIGGPACSVGMLSGQIVMTSTGCVGNVQVLRLRWYDVGLTHGGWNIDKTAYDGAIDTWVCQKDWICGGPSVGLEGNIATGQDAEWVDMFPSSINVKRFSFQIYPVKDPWLSWAAPDAVQGSTEVSPFIHPYIRMNLELGFAWGNRRLIKNDDPTISISTAVSLGDFN